MEKRITYEFTRDELELLLDGLDLLEAKYKNWVDVYTDHGARELRLQLEEGL